MAQEGLGRLINIQTGLAPYDTNAGAGTGLRIHMKDLGGVTIVFYKGAGTGTDVPVLTFQQHTVSSSGSPANLAIIDHWYQKSATTLTGSETWSKQTQAASQTVTLTGEATKQGIYVFEIEAASLSDGYQWVSVNIADTGSAGAQLGSVLYLGRDLHIQRKPANLADLLA